MKTASNQFLQLTGTTLTLVLILGALAMVWAGIIGLFLGIFLFFSSFGGDQASLVLSSSQIGSVMMAFGLRQ